MVNTMIEIRSAQASDTPGVAELVRQLGYTGDSAQVEQTLRRLRESPVDVALVAVVENVTVGVVAVRAVPPPVHRSRRQHLLRVGGLYRRSRGIHPIHQGP